MNFITNYYAQSSMALASYADLSPGVDPIFALQAAGMTGTQANEFASFYTVLDRQVDAFGLSVTLFQDALGNQTGK